eukprot:TRINITY_DN7798_c0_g1_i1.p1 TRINITY_DN7798_c0_g1~~TRINITY_DN7798_c0_g1_i1.p1  ORF type:complete len:318 (+),score=31.85 TRINITY_DN7798_c0_g1_i1:101-1054(+)
MLRQSQQREKPDATLFDKVSLMKSSVRRSKPAEICNNKTLFLVIVLYLFVILLVSVYIDNSTLNIVFLFVSILVGLYILSVSPTFASYIHSHITSEARRQAILNRPKRIILIRHGESEGNIDAKIYSVTADNQVPLTYKGKLQAEEAGRKLIDLVQDETVRFFVSPYQRSLQTFEYILKGSGISKSKYSVREEPRLREQDWGNFQNPENVKLSMLERRKFGAFYFRFPQGESGADVYDRVTSFWESVYREFKFTHCLENFVMISHGVTLRLFLMRYFKWTVEEFHSLWNFQNCQMVIMELNDQGTYQLTAPLKQNPI